MSENIVDFLIIGASAAGAAAAYNLADTGTSILCLEQRRLEQTIILSFKLYGLGVSQ